MLTRSRSFALSALAITMFAACSDSTDGGGGGGGGGNTTLTVSAATPSSGNGNLGGIIVTVDTNAAVQQGPAIFITVNGDVGGVLHQIDLYILKSDGSFPNIEHKWGSDLLAPDGFTICDANGGRFPVCDPAHVSADLAQEKVTLSDLVLGAATGDGDTSTLTGTIQ